MSKTKRMLEENRGSQPIDHGKFLDDEYQYQHWQKTITKVGEPPPVSNCHEAPINNFNSSTYSFKICTVCHRFCGVK